MDYSFETLNDIDFELFVCDLLNECQKSRKESWQFRTFAAGKDKGIDLLDTNSEGESYKCIVQVKHYLRTSYSTMASHLFKNGKDRKSELEKIRILAPKRYILVTSKDLTLANRNEIVAEMEPFILSRNDIIDRGDLNRLISEFPQVEQRHFKLWFSGTIVLERILKSHFFKAGADFSTSMLERIKLYVEVNQISLGRKILEQTQCLVITGEPGCGKTTYAEMILMSLIGEGFEIFNIIDSVAEFEQILGNDEDKQIFFFDDFLGHTRYEMALARGKEKSLLSFVHRISTKKNKYFVATTRSSLIASASLDSEKFSRSVLFQKKYEISVNELSLSSKIRIIENHKDVFALTEKHASILNEDFIKQIANHPNFSPRLIEFVTTKRTIDNVDVNAYRKYIVDQLENPTEIWLHAFEQQINDLDRFLLTTLYSFGREVEERELELGFEQRILTESQLNSFTRSTGAFNNCMKKLLGGFLTIKHYHNRETIAFINPSLEDFLNRYLSNDHSERLRIVNAAYYVDQVFSRFRAGLGEMAVNPTEFFRKRLESEAFAMVGLEAEFFKMADAHLNQAFVCHMFFQDVRGQRCTAKLLKRIEWPFVLCTNEFYFFDFLELVSNFPIISQIIESNFDLIIWKYAGSCTQITNMEKILGLFVSYGRSYDEFISDEDNSNHIADCIVEIFEEEIIELEESLTNHATDLDAIYDEIQELEELIADCYVSMKIENDIVLNRLRCINWDSICLENAFKAAMDDEDQARGAIRAFDGD